MIDDETKPKMARRMLDYATDESNTIKLPNTKGKSTRVVINPKEEKKMMLTTEDFIEFQNDNNLSNKATDATAKWLRKRKGKTLLNF